MENQKYNLRYQDFFRKIPSVISRLSNLVFLWGQTAYSRLTMVNISPR